MPVRDGPQETHRHVNQPDKWKPRFTGDALRARLREYNREPFLDLLASFMESFPNDEAIERFANEKPDKFIAAMRQLQQMSGFVDRRETDTNINVTVGKMSDAELRDRVRKLSGEMGEPESPPIIDVTPEEQQT